MYGGKWISFLGIPPFTPIFLYLVFVNLQLKHVQKFFRIRGDILFGLALVPLVWLFFGIIGIWFPSPLLLALGGVLLVISLIFPVLVIIRQVLRPFFRRPSGSRS
jgi:hypothetical protein